MGLKALITQFGFNILLCSSNISLEEHIRLIRVVNPLEIPLKVWEGWQLEGWKDVNQWVCYGD